MDYRVRIILLASLFSYSIHGLETAEEEIPPPLQSHPPRITTTLSTSLRRSGITSKESAVVSKNPITAGPNKSIATRLLSSTLSGSMGSITSPKKNASISKNATSPNAAAPEFEDRNIQDEGGKGEEEPDARVDLGTNVSPPADDEAAGEGIAKEDTEPVKGKDKEEVGAMVEDAKGNAPAPLTPSKFQPRIDFDQSEDSHFMTFIFVAGLLVFCLYLLHHNKKKILGLVFEGRSGNSRRNVRYRRLSQRDGHESYKEDIVY